MIITGNKLSHSIRLKIDRVEQTITPEIQTQDKIEGADNTTTIEIHVPESKNDYKDLVNVVLDYGILNPHISFDIDVDLDGSHEGLYGKWNALFPQTQQINPEWSNRPSVHYYNLDEFKQLINGLEDNDAKIRDILFSLDFREANNVPLDAATETLRELKIQPTKISEIYDKLRRTMFGVTPDIKTQFDTNKRVRTEAMKKRIEQFGFQVSNTKYRLVHQKYASDDGQIKFAFIFEIGMFYSNLNASYIVDGINSSYRPNSPFVGGYTNTYTWISGRKGEKQNSAQTVNDILTKYGYTTSSSQDNKSRKGTALIVLNLICPRIDYEGYSKSHINLRPFAATIAETVYKIASESSPVTGDGTIASGKDIVREILKERLDAILANAELKITDRWTQSTVYYRTRKRMLERGVRLTERETITRQIKEICEEWKVAREELGIYAADRAQLYFRGEVRDVNLEEMHSLKQSGTDLVIIEKEGVAEVLSPFAAKYGIAILNTRGFLTDYAKALSELSEHVVILTDLNDSGLEIANKVPDIPRIGIDFGTLEYFELEHKDVEEDYQHGDHFKNLHRLSEEGELDEDIDALLPYIENKRIEIDSVLAEVGNERFWEFVIYKLLELFPHRNYNRAIKTPQDIIPEEVEDLIETLKKKCNEVAASKRKQIETQLKDFEGFIDNIDKKDEDIEQEIRNTLSQDNDIKSLLSDIENLEKKYDLESG